MDYSIGHGFFQARTHHRHKTVSREKFVRLLVPIIIESCDAFRGETKKNQLHNAIDSELRYSVVSDKPEFEITEIIGICH